MIRFRDKLNYAFLGIALAFLSGTTAAMQSADSDELCAPFEDAEVDETVIATMLASAKEGHLYRIQPSSSRVGFCVDGPFGRVEGEFKDFRGGLTFMNDVQTSEEKALVMVKTHSLETDAPLIEDILKGDGFFNAEKFPEILFVSTGFEWINEKEASLIGKITLNGITRIIGFHVELLEEPDEHETVKRISVKATTLIDRSEFGLTSLFPMVSDQVTLCMSVDAIKFEA